MALSALPPRFPLLGKVVAIVFVLLALIVALQIVSGIVAEREGRLREAEASVAASLAGAQTVLGPILQRDCSETWEAVQGEGKDRKLVTERRSWKLAAAPAELAVTAQVGLEPRYRGIFKVNGYVMKATLAASWPDGSALVPRAEHAGSRLRCDPPTVMLALGDSRGVRSAAVQVDGKAVAVLPGTAHPAHGRGFHVAHRRRLGRRGPAARAADGDRAGRHRRAGVRAGRRFDPGRAGFRLAASVLRRPFPAARADRDGNRLSCHLEAECIGDDGAAAGHGGRRRLCQRLRSGRRAARAGKRPLRRDLRRFLHRPGRRLHPERPGDQVRGAVHRPHLPRRGRDRGAAPGSRPSDPVPAGRIGDRDVLPAPGEPRRAPAVRLGLPGGERGLHLAARLLRQLRAARRSAQAWRSAPPSRRSTPCSTCCSSWSSEPCCWARCCCSRSSPR